MTDNLADLVAGMNKLTDEPLLDHEHLKAQIEARDLQVGNPFSKNAQIIAINGARNYLGDKLIRTAKLHRILDAANGPLIDELWPKVVDGLLRRCFEVS